MRRVAIAEFKDKASEYVASAEAGAEIEITRYGRVAARLLPPDREPSKSRRRLLEAMLEAGRTNRDACGPTSAVQIRQWIEADRP